MSLIASTSTCGTIRQPPALAEGSDRVGDRLQRAARIVPRGPRLPRSPHGPLWRRDRRAVRCMTPERQFDDLKPETSSAALSHLFAQAHVSARPCQGSSEFRSAVRGLLAGRGSILDFVRTGRPIRVSSGHDAPHRTVWRTDLRGRRRHDPQRPRCAGQRGRPTVERGAAMDIVGAVEFVGHAVDSARVWAAVGAMGATGVTMHSS